MYIPKHHIYLFRRFYKRYMNLKTIQKLVLIYILVFFIPTVTLTYALYTINYQFLAEKYFDSEDSTVTEAKNNLIIQLNQISAMSNYFQNSEALKVMLNGNYTTLSDTIYHYRVDVLPLLKSTRYNTYVTSTRVYGFGEYLLNMRNGFSSIDYFDKSDAFIAKIRSSLHGIWELTYTETNIPELTYYKFIYSDIYPYELGIVTFDIDFTQLLQNFKQQIKHPIYLYSHAYPDPILYEDGQFTPSTSSLNELRTKNKHSIELYLDELNQTLIIPIPLMPQATQNVKLLLVALSFLLVAFTGLYFLFSSSFTMRLSNFSKHIRQSSADDLQTFDTLNYTDEVGYVISHYNELVIKINQLIYENYYIQLQSKDAEFYALQAQINPHFLYNILENIRMCAEEHKDNETSAMIQLLANFMRYNLNSNVGLIPFEEELKAAKNYLSIHKIRHGNKLIFNIEAYTDISATLCPRFILQPLLENALKHGMHSDKSLNIVIIVRISNDYPEFIQVIVKDNGMGISEGRIEEINTFLTSKRLDFERHVGLMNVNNRIITYSGISDAGLKIDSQHGSGTSISFLLPISHTHSSECINEDDKNLGGAK